MIHVVIPCVKTSDALIQGLCVLELLTGKESDGLLWVTAVVA